MGYHKLKISERTLEIYVNDFSYYIKENWKIYLDDCFILWNENLDKPRTFQASINTNLRIQFTMPYSNNNKKNFTF